MWWARRNPEKYPPALCYRSFSCRDGPRIATHGICSSTWLQGGGTCNVAKVLARGYTATHDPNAYVIEPVEKG